MHQLPLDGAMPTVAGVEFVGHAHFLTPEERSGFQHTVYLRERACLVRRMAGRFYRVAPVKGAVLDGAHVHETAREIVHQAVKSRLGVQRLRLVQLDFVVIQPHYPDAGLPHDAPHGAADAAANVDDCHALSQLQLVNHQPLMPDFGVFQTFPGR